jgi:hypothetical protein
MSKFLRTNDGVYGWEVGGKTMWFDTIEVALTYAQNYIYNSRYSSFDENEFFSAVAESILDKKQTLEFGVMGKFMYAHDFIAAGFYWGDARDLNDVLPNDDSSDTARYVAAGDPHLKNLQDTHKKKMKRTKK